MSIVAKCGRNRGGPSGVDPVAQFRAAMAERELIPPAEIIADGRIHRCDVAGKNGRNDGSYKLHLDGVPAGGFKNHKDGKGWRTGT